MLLATSCKPYSWGTSTAALFFQGYVLYYIYCHYILFRTAYVWKRLSCIFLSFQFVKQNNQQTYHVKYLKIHRIFGVSFAST